MFKVGDRVKCKPGFSKTEDSGGAGYVTGREFIIGDITNPSHGRAILWPLYSENGIYAEACEYPSNNVWADSKLTFKFIR